MPNSLDRENEITTFARVDFRDDRRVFGIKRKDRRSHMLLVGKTGTGKSTMLLNMILSDLRKGEGLAVVDVHGDLVEKVLRLIPQERMGQVIYFNPQDVEHPMGFNLLEGVEPSQCHLTVSSLISVFKRIWPEFWGPRTEYILKNAVLALLDYPGSTLLEIPRMLTDVNFRRKVVEKTKNPQVRDFWTKEFEGYSKYFRSEAISPILNKVGEFLIIPLLRNIVGQPKSAFDFRQVMDEGKIFLVNLSKGQLGEDISSLLGAMIITKVGLVALSRSDTPEGERHDFYLYADEFHGLTPLSFINLLGEIRKYHVGLILSLQYLEQVEENVQAALWGNIGTIVAFRVGIRDAELLTREFYPVFEETDFINLPNYHIYLKLMIDGVTSRPFSAVTLPPPKNKTGKGS